MALIVDISSPATPASVTGRPSHEENSKKPRAGHFSIPASETRTSHIIMPGLTKTAAHAEGSSPTPLYSQSLVVGDMVYLSGITGVDWATGNLVDGSVGDRTASTMFCGSDTKSHPRADSAGSGPNIEERIQGSRGGR